jgi:hypothetical protein
MFDAYADLLFENTIRLLKSPTAEVVLNNRTIVKKSVNQ